MKVSSSMKHVREIRNKFVGGKKGSLNTNFNSERNFAKCLSKLKLVFREPQSFFLN